jgi:hypothetical protein
VVLTGRLPEPAVCAVEERGERGRDSRKATELQREGCGEQNGNKTPLHAPLMGSDNQKPETAWDINVVICLRG